VKTAFDLSGFSKALAAERQKLTAATRPAAQAATQVIYEAARVNAPVSDKAHFFYGRSSAKTGVRYGPFRPGNLRDSIYQAFSPERSGPARATYRISVNLTKAPYAAMVEYGTSKAASQSYIGKAFADKTAAAMEAMRVEFINRVNA
jgi:HK97 gp10 family phage protein